METFEKLFNAIRLDVFAALFAAGGITAFWLYRLVMAIIRLSNARVTTMDKIVSSLAEIAEDKTDATRELPETLLIKITVALQPALIRLDRLESDIELITAMLARMEIVDGALRSEMSAILGEVRTVKDQLTPVMHSLETGEHDALTWGEHDH